MRISNYPTDTITGAELILATDVDTSTQKYKTVNFSVDTLKAYVNTVVTLTGAGSTIDTENLTVSRALISNSSGKVAVSDVTSTELAYLDVAAVGTVQSLKAVIADANGDITMNGVIKYGGGTTSPNRVDLQSTQAVTFNETQGILQFDSPDAGIANDALSAEITFTNNKILSSSAVIIAHIGTTTAPCEILVYGVATGSCKIKILNKSGGAIADGANININFSVINTN